MAHGSLTNRSIGLSGLCRLGVGRLRRFRRRLTNSMLRTDPRYRQNKIDTQVSLGDTVLEGMNVIGKGSVLAGDVTIGFGTTLGRRNVIHGGSIIIGRYSQLAPEVALYAVNHPYSHLTSYVNSNLFGGRMKEHLRHSSLTIGSDVWIGHGAIVLNGVTVGDGAVIGGGSVVVHDIPPYAIAAGNPARVLKQRFPEEIVTMLLELKWWDLSEDRLMRCEPLFHIDFETQPDEFERLLREALLDRCNSPVNGAAQ